MASTPVKPFGRTRRQLASVILALGLYTFVEPLVTFSKPAFGRTQWSAWNIVSSVHEGKLLHLPEMLPDLIFNVVFVIPVTYVFMLVALIVLWFPRSQKALRVIGGIGTIVSIENI